MASVTTGLRTGMFDSYELPHGEVVADIGGADGSVLVQLIKDCLTAEALSSTCLWPCPRRGPILQRTDSATVSRSLQGTSLAASPAQTYTSSVTSFTTGTMNQPGVF